jgi:hypothetical protein
MNFRYWGRLIKYIESKGALIHENQLLEAFAAEPLAPRSTLSWDSPTNSPTTLSRDGPTSTTQNPVTNSSKTQYNGEERQDGEQIVGVSTGGNIGMGDR